MRQTVLCVEADAAASADVLPVPDPASGPTPTSQSLRVRTAVTLKRERCLMPEQCAPRLHTPLQVGRQSESRPSGTDVAICEISGRVTVAVAKGQ